jgi:hypothetical protein
MSVAKKFIFLLFVVLIASAKVWGQAARSPFTTYGIGEPYGNALVHQQGMGGLGVSQPQFWFLNNQNPALLVYNSLTVFQAGILGESRTIKSDATSEKSKSGNMNYLATAFPVKPGKWSTSIGLMPYTTVNYEVQYQKQVMEVGSGAVVDTVLVSETGSGGLTQLYWSNGVRINREISVGLKASYLFGPIDNVYSNQTTIPNQIVPYVVHVEEKTTVNDFLFGLGFSFSRDSLGAKKNHRFSVGAVYNFSTNLKAKKTDKIFRTNVSSNDTIESFTLEKQHGQIEIPSSFTVGASYGRDLKWAVATEFSFQNWSSFKSINKDDEGLSKSWKASLGGEFTPDPFAYENFFKRITYRAGVSYEQYPFLANGNEVKDLGASFGLSLPAGRSSLDLAFKFGKRGDRAENILEESYFKIYFGITFNDQWFIKRKFD